jgi:hypothetical protein
LLVVQQDIPVKCVQLYRCGPGAPAPGPQEAKTIEPTVSTRLLAIPGFDGTAREAALALRTALDAYRLCIQLTAGKRFTTTLERPDHSPVTTVDFAIQALVGWYLEQAFPRATSVAEEDSALLHISPVDLTAVALQAIRMIGADRPVGPTPP